MNIFCSHILFERKFFSKQPIERITKGIKNYTNTKKLQILIFYAPLNIVSPLSPLPPIEREKINHFFFCCRPFLGAGRKYFFSQSPFLLVILAGEQYFFPLNKKRIFRVEFCVFR